MKTTEVKRPNPSALAYDLTIEVLAGRMTQEDAIDQLIEQKKIDVRRRPVA